MPLGCRAASCIGLSYVNEVNGGASVTAGCRRPIRALADGSQCEFEVLQAGGV